MPARLLYVISYAQTRDIEIDVRQLLSSPRAKERFGYARVRAVPVEVTLGASRSLLFYADEGLGAPAGFGRSYQTSSDGALTPLGRVELCLPPLG
ncbi:hypothetical protein DL767_008157 [Monosporascus sp. MG133]|nr:hypothetical protein DL767_008157 [Monosporascus sp. MG133]